MTNKEYTAENSEYLKDNPTWHVEQSPWKATQILKMVERNNLKPATVVEIGCGAGEILNQLYQRMADKNIQFYGYEVAPDAFALSQSRIKDRLHFFYEDLLQNNKVFDLLLMIDVFEHVDDYLGFLRKSKEKATYKIFHIPMDIAVLSVINNNPMKQRKDVGHLHYYTKDTALATLKDTGHEIIDWFYTKGGLEIPNQKLNLTGRGTNFLRRIFYAISPNFAVKMFGGFSLMVLAK
jgi:2-polyprenyl-3-methyl-5-hydroxy-6-metoxy-1,4-benzoquinol methylase